jgi:2-dehydro-3-deoxygalactonokinase
MNNKDRVDAQLIALDWGTSSLRAYLLGNGGAILDQISLPLGIMRLAHSEASGRGAQVFQAFESAFEQVCGPWLGMAPSLPILASGMVGSAQGWCEAPYLRVPVDLAELSKHLTQLTTSTRKLIYIVPGLIRHEELVNVMRGEETQILGALEAVGPSMSRNLLIGLPGTHSKWVHVKDRIVENFETFMTGEVYAALCEHSIFAHTLKRESSFLAAAFERRVRVTITPVGDLGVLSNIFSVRTLGDASLCARYEKALKFHQCESVTIITDAAARGLWKVAGQANLVSSTQVPPETTLERSR